MKRFVSIFLALAMVVLSASGCEEEADCAGACEHQCDVCDTGCDPTNVDACINSCINMDTSPDRTDCIIAAPTCDDIWKC
jgi:hypothetical protein